MAKKGLPTAESLAISVNKNLKKKPAKKKASTVKKKKPTPKLVKGKQRDMLEYGNTLYLYNRKGK